MTVEASPEAPAPDAVLPTAERLRIFTAAGLLLLLLYLAAPYAGLIGIPISFFLKNKLHLSAHELAQFSVWTGAPLYLSFVFGMVRDRWSPFGAGDRGHLMVFGGVTAAVYIAMAFVSPTYAMLLAGFILLNCSIQIVSSAANGLVSTIGQQHIMTGQIGAVLNLATWIPVLAASLLGGVFSEFLEAQGAADATRILFLAAAVLTAAIAIFGAMGPRRLFGAVRPERAVTGSLVGDVRRLLRHWPIYPPLLLLLLWDFSPATGTALQYHLANTLHATDTQFGEFTAILVGAAVPAYVLYGFLCQHVRLSVLLFWGTILAIPQMLPLLLVHSTATALLVAVPMGLTGGIATGAYVDLAIRSCPRGLQGTMMMLVATVYWVAGRFGDLWGADLYDHGGGFVIAALATTAVYALMLPTLLLVPRGLTSTSDGEARTGGGHT